MGDIVNMNISSTISTFGSERRFSKSLLISEIKVKLELITGVQSSYMELQMFNAKSLVFSLLEDDKMLGYYSPQDYWRIHVIDKNPNSTVGEFDDLSKVEKYEMDESEYEKKEDSVRNFMKKNKMGKFSDVAKDADQKLLEKEIDEEKLARTFNLNDRCEVTIKNSAKRRGQITYIGEVEFKPGYWIGVKYDEPVGKNDGSIQGKRYFTCTPKYGGFIRPSQVEVGDFPEEEIDFSDNEM